MLAEEWLRFYGIADDLYNDEHQSNHNNNDDVDGQPTEVVVAVVFRWSLQNHTPPVRRT